MGMTHIRLGAAKEEVLAGALCTAWKLRLEKNAKSGQRVWRAIFATNVRVKRFAVGWVG